MDKQVRFKFIIGSILVCVGICLIILKIAFDFDILLGLFIYAILFMVIVAVFYFLDKWQSEADNHVEDTLKSSVQSALKLSNIGIVYYDEDYEITYMSNMFANYNINARNEKLLSWIPELQELLAGERDSVIATLENEHTYEIYKKENGSVLLFKDITVQYNLEKKYKDEELVFGMVNFDNYDVVAESEEDISTINTELKLPVIEYFKKYNVVYKTLRNNRLFLILNEKIFADLAEDRFSIINTVRKESKKAELPITLSMAFARGSNDFAVLDGMVSNLLDLAQTRGGDQVVVRKQNEDVIYYGGSSEAREKSSKVRVRVMTNSIKDLIQRSSNVIIVGHQDADADCIGSALCMSAIAQSFKKDTIIITKTGGVEPMIANVLERYKEELEERHHFVTINEALNHLEDDTLVIMVDHHSAAQSNGQELLARAKRVIIIDHHRRKADLDVEAILVYVEASASSACELTTEFLPYLASRVDISPIEANIMYLGILIDTNRFRVRTGARTFDVCRNLRQYGADPTLVEELNEEPYEMIMKRSQIIDNSKLYSNGIIIAAVENGLYPRSIMSQASDSMLQTRGVKAVFVIAPVTDNEVAISARSKGGFNVQVVMEKMHGGGHMTAAGGQYKDGNVEELKAQLIEKLNEYLKGV